MILMLFFVLALCLVSSSTSFILRNTVDANFGNIRAYNSLPVLVLQVISFFIVPVFLLFKYFSWWQAILLYTIGILLSKYISKMVAFYLIRDKHAHLIAILGMLIGLVSAFFIGGKSYEDGFYCAKVEYYNPNTERERTYHLSVEVQDNKVIQLFFPNDGLINEDNFEAPEIDAKGKALVVDERDYEYTISNLEEGECDDFEE